MIGSLFGVVPVAGGLFKVQSKITGRRSVTTFATSGEALGLVLKCDRLWNDGVRPIPFRIVDVDLDPEDADPEDPRTRVADLTDALGRVHRVVFDAYDDDGFRVDVIDVDGEGVTPCLNVSTMEHAIADEILDRARRGPEE